MKKIKSLLLFAILCIVTPIFFTGCREMVEIEDRDFVLAVGVSLDAGQFKLMFVRPNLSELTGLSAKQGESFILTLKGNSYSDAESKYSLESNKKLDYSHLKTIVFDESIVKDEEKMREVLTNIESNYEISRSTLVFLSKDKTDKLLNANKTISGGIGDYLESLNKNNLTRKGEENKTIGQLIASMNEKNKTAIVPIIKLTSKRIAKDGNAIFADNIWKETINSEDNVFFDIANGYGEDTNFRIPSEIYFKLKKVDRKCNFSLRDGKPYLLYQINGHVVFVEGNNNTNEDTIKNNKKVYQKEINDFIKAKLVENFDKFIKKEDIDVFNLYRMTATKNRKIWMEYQDKLPQFLNDLQIGVVVNFKIK